MGLNGGPLMASLIPRPRIYEGRRGEAKQAAREAPMEAMKNRFSSLPRWKESRRSGPYRFISANGTLGSPTPSYQLRFVLSPQVLAISPSRLRPRIALTRPGGARVKVGGAVPLAEPELSLLCLETMRKRRTNRIIIYKCVDTQSIGGPLPPCSMCRA
jgi:hypothetical protein